MAEQQQLGPGTITPTTKERSDDRAALGRIAMVSILAGLCPVIPIPFVDDLALRFIRKRAIHAELERGGLSVGRAQLDVYLGAPAKLTGCLATATLYPLKKVFKKIFIFLAIKDCVDAASQAFHELWMVQHAVKSDQLTSADITVEPDALMPLRRTVEATSRQIDTRPVNQVLKRGFSSSKALLCEAGKTLGNTIRTSGGTRQNPDSVERAVDGVERQMGKVDKLADDLSEQLWTERSYLKQVEATFDDNWRKRGT